MAPMPPPSTPSTPPAQPPSEAASPAPASPTHQGPQNTPRRQAGFGFILVTILIDILGIGLIIPVLPQLVKSLAGGDEVHVASTYGVVVAVYATMQFLCAPLLGALSDRFGRRPVLLISVFGTACDYVVMALSPTLWLLFVGRIINGITAANITTANAYVADVTAPEQRAKRFGMTGAAFGIGFILGPTIGGLLGQYDLRYPFAFAALLAFTNFFYGLFVLPESHPPKNRSAFNLAKANPLGSLVVLRRFRGVVPLAVVLSLLNFAQFSLHSVWVLYTGYRYGWGPKDVGLSLGLVGVMAVIVQGGLTGRIVRKIGEYNALYLGLFVAVAAYAGYGLAPTPHIMYAVIVYGSLAGVLMPAAQAIITREVGPTNQGLAQGALSSLSALTAIFAPLTATWLFSHFAGPDAIAPIPGISFLLGSALSLVGLLIAVVAVRPHRAVQG